MPAALPTLAANTFEVVSNDTTSALPANIMESLAPLLGGQFSHLLKVFMVMEKMVGDRLVLNPALILTSFGVLWAVNRVGRQMYSAASGLVDQHLRSYVSISSHDELYLHMIRFLGAQPKLAESLSLTAETISKTAWEEQDDYDLAPTMMPVDGYGEYLNFSNQKAKAPPRFVPAPGAHEFQYCGRTFQLYRRQESSNNAFFIPHFKDRETLIMSCFGRSPEPIKSLLRHVKEEFYLDHHAKTVVKRPSSHGGGHMNEGYGARHSWMLVANRPVRPMKTVVLDDDRKKQLLDDINEYLHPDTPRWYASRGIPLRRGYLFYGPPGTGKTSLSFALAGVFGLDIYVISLLEPSLTEDNLATLFNSLPRRCVVLLEDIDTAGLSRPPDESTPKCRTVESVHEGQGGSGENNGGSGENKGSSDNNGNSAEELRRVLKIQSANSTTKQGISLSGLLNAVDGVASQEGRVLIMTTNKPETLDEALIRPGRVDMQIAFTNASQKQAEELFKRMYEADGTDEQRRLAAERLPTDGTTVKTQQNGYHVHNHSPNLNDESAKLKEKGKEVASSSQVAVPDDEKQDITPAELSIIAEEFAARIPSSMIISPAEIQGFLLKRKRNPRRALAEVGDWVADVIVQKKNRTKTSHM
ncbi:P-loop containing nucleoside triphosphate hydrolase protein [Podospora appendiculata]|uniref:P-loop containing nucleoside triphosphate hydrolase protein n=1 Tax=Podospora appendiculata TaxID=314037 RepID=A0AAE1CAJ6_9PEZI|nr:P-loop containing nucleoside triphosphate hydrolase protein [Podospora appendiculata]